MCRSYLRNGEYRAVLLGVSRSGAGSGMIQLRGFAVRFPAPSDSLRLALAEHVSVNAFEISRILYHRRSGVVKGAQRLFFIF